MNILDEYQNLKGFHLEGSVLVAWKKSLEDKREFIGIRFAEFDESYNEILEINSSDGENKYNVLVPVYQLEKLPIEKQKELILQNLHNSIWNWKEDYDFVSIIGNLYL